MIPLKKTQLLIPCTQNGYQWVKMSLKRNMGSGSQSRFIGELTHLTPEFDRSERRGEERKKKSKTQ